MGGKLLIYVESLGVLALQLIERWLIAMTGIAGISGGAMACVLFVVSSGYFFPELRAKSKTLFIAGGLVSLIGGTLLLNQIGHWVGLLPQWTESAEVQAPSTGSDAIGEVPLTDDSASSAETGGSSSVFTDPLPTIHPTYTVLSSYDGGWPALWSEVSSSAYTVASIPTGTEVQLTGACISDVSNNSWCPVSYGFLSGWIGSNVIAAK